MKRSWLLHACALWMVFSCEHKDLSTTCGTADPTHDLAWLKAEIDRLESDDTGFSQYVYIRQGDYQGSTVFVTTNCCPFCLTLPPEVKNCEGQTLFSLNCDDPRTKDVVFSKIIWKGKDFWCAL